MCQRFSHYLLLHCSPLALNIMENFQVSWRQEEALELQVLVIRLKKDRNSMLGTIKIYLIIIRNRIQISFLYHKEENERRMMNQREEYQEENPGHSSSKYAIKIPYPTCFQKLISCNYS